MEETKWFRFKMFLVKILIIWFVLGLIFDNYGVEVMKRNECRTIGCLIKGIIK